MKKRDKAERKYRRINPEMSAIEALTKIERRNKYKVAYMKDHPDAPDAQAMDHALEKMNA